MRRPEAELAAASPALPRDEAGPVFAAPWQAQAFAIAVHLLERGRMTPGEWAAALGAEIAAAGPQDRPEDYYQHWLDALEKLAAAKSFASRYDLSRRQPRPPLLRGQTDLDLAADHAGFLPAVHIRGRRRRHGRGSRLPNHRGDHGGQGHHCDGSGIHADQHPGRTAMRHFARQGRERSGSIEDQ